MARPFHLAFPVCDLESTRAFYLGVLGAREGRCGEDWVDLDFFGSQLVAHVMERAPLAESGVNQIDGHDVPLPHFGAVLEMGVWKQLSERLSREDLDWVLRPHVRYEGRVNEQASMILRDPSGNVVELKAFADESLLFAKAPPAG